MRYPTRRRFLASGGAALSSALLLPPARAQTPKLSLMRIGVIMPAMTGLSSVRTSVTDYAGEGARMGAIKAEKQLGVIAEERGVFLDIVHANAPSGQAARRAAERMIEVHEVCALIGGIGDGQAEVLAAIAAKARIPFFNIGSSRDALRQGDCSRYTFHIEASAAMYLDALAASPAAKDRRRWFVLYEDDDDGRAMHARAVKAVAKQGSGATVVGAAAVKQEQPVYYNELNAVRRADADVVLLLIDAVDQFAFVGQKESVAPDLPIVAFPYVVSQTRDYIAYGREVAPEIAHRMVLWETTLKTNGAAEFNDAFLTRWGVATDPTAWSAYSAIKVLYEASQATGTLASAALISYLESPAAVFDLGKGPGSSFRPWDHQLRQPLYMLQIDPDAPWVRTDVATWINVARLEAEFPDGISAGGDPRARLDRLGDGPEGSSCRL